MELLDIENKISNIKRMYPSTIEKAQDLYNESKEQICGHNPLLTAIFTKDEYKVIVHYGTDNSECAPIESLSSIVIDGRNMTRICVCNENIVYVMIYNSEQLDMDYNSGFFLQWPCKFICYNNESSANIWTMNNVINCLASGDLFNQNQNQNQNQNLVAVSKYGACKLDEMKNIAIQLTESKDDALKAVSNAGKEIDDRIQAAINLIISNAARDINEFK